MEKNKQDAQTALAELNETISNINFLVASMENFIDVSRKAKLLKRKRHNQKKIVEDFHKAILEQHNNLVDRYSLFTEDKSGDPIKFQAVIDELNTSKELQEKAFKAQCELDFLDNAYFQITEQYEDFSPARYEHLRMLYQESVAKYNYQILRTLYYIDAPTGYLHQIVPALAKSETEISRTKPETFESLAEKLQLIKLANKTDEESNEN